jgi:hypothetical protein
LRRRIVSIIAGLAGRRCGRRGPLIPQHKRKARRLSRGGRPRKEGPRTPSGQRSRSIKTNPRVRDEGTKQFIAKREAMINGAAPELSATASGILLANGFLTREQHTAALRYAWAHDTTFGRVWGQISPLGETMGMPASDMSPKAKKKLAYMDKKLSDEQRQAVANVSAFNLIPNWFYVAIEAGGATRGPGRASGPDLRARCIRVATPPPPPGPARTRRAHDQAAAPALP